MLDAIAQSLVDHTAKPVDANNVSQPQAALIASQKTVVPILQPTVSAPESIAPTVVVPSNAASFAAAAPTPPQAKATQASVVKAITAPSVATPTATSTAQKTTVSPVQKEQTVETARREAKEQAKVEQRKILAQRLADIVAHEKPLKDAKLRENLKASAIDYAKAGQVEKARQAAHDLMLSPDTQADLLAQITALEANRLPAKSALAVKPLVVKPSSKPSLPSSAKATWMPTTVEGRSLPAPLQYTPPPYSYVPQTQYVSYALNSFGRTIGGIGVVVNPTLGFNEQGNAAYATGTRFKPGQWNGISFIFPLAVPAAITSSFGWRVHPITGDRRFHSGTDLGAPMGTPVIAAAAGKVALSDWLNGYGLAIILSHNKDTQETLYGHLSEVFVKPGQWVDKGTVIGRVGSTGLSTGPHLHFELRQLTPEGWQAIDPGMQLEYALAQLVKAIQAG